MENLAEVSIVVLEVGGNYKWRIVIVVISMELGGAKKFMWFFKANILRGGVKG